VFNSRKPGNSEEIVVLELSNGAFSGFPNRFANTGVKRGGRTSRLLVGILFLEDFKLPGQSTRSSSSFF
jgi:hypothetical protein